MPSLRKREETVDILWNVPVGVVATLDSHLKTVALILDLVVSNIMPWSPFSEMANERRPG